MRTYPITKFGKSTIRHLPASALKGNISATNPECFGSDDIILHGAEKLKNPISLSICLAFLFAVKNLWVHSGSWEAIFSNLHKITFLFAWKRLQSVVDSRVKTDDIAVRLELTDER